MEPHDRRAGGEPAKTQDTARAFTGQLLGLLANVTALTALLVYFGWRRAETQAHRMGFDESLLGMSTQDYVLRSIGPVLPILLAIAVLGMGWLWVDRVVGRSIQRRGRLARWWPWLAVLLALALPMAVVASQPSWVETAYVVGPLAIGAGVLLLAYSAVLRSRLAGNEVGPSGLATIFVVLAAGVCLFWAASNRAEVLGNQLADNFAYQLPDTVRVTVYSTNRLYLHTDAPGAVEEALSEPDGAYRYRYRGLRLLDHIGDRYFLVSDGWTQQRGVVIALADADTLRFEFARGTTG
jgi:hypothetical protein